MFSSDPWNHLGKREVYTLQKQAQADCPAFCLPTIPVSEQVPSGRRRGEGRGLRATLPDFAGKVEGSSV